ncbi:hypothetical protein DFH05DRAFT_861754 [Lentinula detonsa]|uniref:Uncharacterized protein n=1 Tax=Lentinula detonsa TaxID=2804962 RepID=A0A9W8P6E0_9AGAR|nr:hypothetical protein DFH05DRAFT_861754 [Lentinula detonsa]
MIPVNFEAAVLILVLTHCYSRFRRYVELGGVDPESDNSTTVTAIAIDDGHLVEKGSAHHGCAGLTSLLRTVRAVLVASVTPQSTFGGQCTLLFV